MATEVDDHGARNHCPEAILVGFCNDKLSNLPPKPKKILKEYIHIIVFNGIS